MVTRIRSLSLRALLGDELGASLIEYALMMSLVAITCVFSITLLGANTKHSLTQVSTAMTDASGAPTSGGQNSGGNNGNGNDNGKGGGNDNGGNENHSH